MVRLNVAEGPLRKYGLSEVSRTVRGGKMAGARPSSLIGLRQPSYVKLRKGDLQDDPELLIFLRDQEKQHLQYHYVKLGCSFEPAGGEAFDRAILEVHLKSTDPASTAVVWSMSPRQEYTKGETSAGAEVGANLQLVSSSIKTGETAETRAVYIQAFSEGTSNSYWEFRKTAAVELTGSVRLNMIVRAPAGEKTRGDLRLFAFLKQRRFAIIPVETEHPSTPELSFEL